MLGPAFGWQSNWLAYGGAESHPCIEPQMEFNLWKSRGSGVKTCDYLREKGLDSGIWEVSCRTCQQEEFVVDIASPDGDRGEAPA